jgi:hypothetical protein
LKYSEGVIGMASPCPRPRKIKKSTEADGMILPDLSASLHGSANTALLATKA